MYATQRPCQRAHAHKVKMQEEKKTQKKLSWVSISTLGISSFEICVFLNEFLMNGRIVCLWRLVDLQKKSFRARASFEY